MSVVDGDYWDELKKYNLTELYSQSNNQGKGGKKPPGTAGEED
jgi:tRNA acetyltransferase TAN1